MDANAMDTNGKVLAKDVMTTDIISVSPETPVKEVARLMIDNKISAVPVVTKFNEIVGVVSENDLISKIVKPHEPGLMSFFCHKNTLNLIVKHNMANCFKRIVGINTNSRSRHGVLCGFCVPPGHRLAIIKHLSA